MILDSSDFLLVVLSHFALLMVDSAYFGLQLFVLILILTLGPLYLLADVLVLVLLDPLY